MKKTSSFLLLLMLYVSVYSQSITLQFTGQDASSHRVQLDRVIVTNLSQNWQETIYWPDTTLTLSSTDGIDDYATTAGFSLSQNNPNPFNGTTDVNLTVADAGVVTLEVADANGRIVGTHRVRPQLGTHQFRVTLSAAGTYIMTARQNGKTSSIKMINNGGGSKNAIEKNGIDEGTIAMKTGEATKGNVVQPWAYGDNLMIMGYATICGTEYSQQFTRQLYHNETFSIAFSGSITLPTASVTSVSNITNHSASVSSSVDSDCGILSRGFCYSTSANPTISGNHISNGSGAGSLSGTINGLTAGTTYFVRSYATNAAGTTYGSMANFTTTNSGTGTLPTVTTNNITNITASSATGGGVITSLGSAPFIQSSGVCWSTSHNPTISNNHTTNAGTNISFSCQLTDLNANTTYYVRAYATTSVGTGYGNEVSFTTQTVTSSCPSPTVTDNSGNTYNTVSIGNKCWMKENLRTTHTTGGTTISGGSGSSTTVPYFYVPNGGASTNYGYLYNYKAVSLGICPTGWHVPTSSELQALANYVGSQNAYICGNNSNYVAKALASTSGWNSSTITCTPGETPSNNNATGFSALPAGARLSNSYSNFGSCAYFWSASEVSNNNSYAWIHCIGHSSQGVSTLYGDKSEGYSVRCVKD